MANSLYRSILLFTTLFFMAGCAGKKHFTKTIIQPVLQLKEIDSMQNEIDEIFTLLAYALVYKDWQPNNVPREKRRGYNIGALLVNSKNEPVYYGLNCINSAENATQHGELRAITGYLDSTRQFDLKGYSIYTTLEPCIMCAGMITMTSVQRVVYGQNDVEYSRAFERLAIDTRPIGGFPPYPRNVIAQPSHSKYRMELDSAYQKFLQTETEKILAKFLTSDEAKDIYRRATDEFLNYHVSNILNTEVYNAALKFYSSVKQ